jgi:hypothetical protein
MTATVIEGMQTWTFERIRPPGTGPWNDEPDKAQWIDQESGFDCLAVRGHLSGAWCGYVGVPPGHPWYGWDYRQLDPSPFVHGGVNYSAPCQEPGEDGYGVCHVPQEGRPTDVWWFGFHCSFANDLAPTEAHNLGLAMGEPDLAEQMNMVYRTFDFVVAETTFLAAQLRIEPLRL